MLKEYHHPENNIGDTLTPIILDWLKIPHQRAKNGDSGKFLGVGSILGVAKENDVVWGSGFIKDLKFEKPKGLKVLAVRGKLSEEILQVDCRVFGDPALLLPLIYNPKIEKTHRTGAIPHYVDVDEPVFKEFKEEGYFMIDVRQDWKSFIDQVLSCKSIVSSSLHGIVIAEAYGIPATWVKPSKNVIGDGFKFADYLTGTGRKPMFNGGRFPPINHLKLIQDRLIQSLTEYIK